MKKFSIFFIMLLLILSFCFLANCSKEKAEKEQYPVRPRSEKAQQALKRLQDIYNRYDRNNKQINGESSYSGNIINDQEYPEEKTRREQIAAVEKCEKAFHKCIEKCKTENCEELCLVDLSNCEKKVPIEVQTLKSY